MGDAVRGDCVQLGAMARGDVSSTREMGEQDHLGPGGATRARLSTDWVEAQHSRGRSFHGLLEIQTERGREILTREMTWGKKANGTEPLGAEGRGQTHRSGHISDAGSGRIRPERGPWGHRARGLRKGGGCFGLSHPSETSGSVRTEEKPIELGN